MHPKPSVKLFVYLCINLLLLRQAEPGSFLGFESSLKGKEVGYPGGPFDPLGLAECASMRIPAQQLAWPCAGASNSGNKGCMPFTRSATAIIETPSCTEPCRWHQIRFTRSPYD